MLHVKDIVQSRDPTCGVPIQNFGANLSVTAKDHASQKPLMFMSFGLPSFFECQQKDRKKQSGIRQSHLKGHGASAP